MFASAGIQYAIRSEGSYDYRFANDLTWNAGPGVFFITEHEGTLALRANLSGEYKENDVFRGNKTDDTAVTSVFLGPELLATLGESLGGELGVDLPIDIDNSGLQAVPDYRLRASVSYRF